MHMQLMSQDTEYDIVRCAMLFALPKGNFHQEAEDIHNQLFEVLCHECVHDYDYHSKKA